MLANVILMHQMAMQQHVGKGQKLAMVSPSEVMCQVTFKCHVTWQPEGD